MSLLRIRASLADTGQRCQWSLVNPGREPVAGEGSLSALPRRVRQVQLLLPAADVLITRVQVPQQARRRAGSALAYAVEERTAREPDANHVSWLGSVGGFDVLAVIDKPGLLRWRDALGAAGISGYEVHCETLSLPWTPGTWSLAWNGREGFVRSGEFEGAVTDCGDGASPPQLLRLLLDEVKAGGAAPDSLALYTTASDAAPDIGKWTRELGITVRLAGTWDWRAAPPGAGVALVQERQRWRTFTGMAARLRPAAWVLGAALAIHAAALVIDWASLASEQRNLRQQMESRFRSTFPEAVAVVDPALQMRRKLSDARHAAGQPDSGDFLPMVDSLASTMKRLPEGGLRILSYESGRMTLELAATDEAAVNRIVAELTQAGLRVLRSTAGKHSGGTTVVLTVLVS
jgi:general secretion pathway protein L